MKKLHNIKISGSKDKPILLDVFYKPNGQAKPIVIYVHGFKGFKDWGHFNVIGEEMANAGFVFVKFNFSYNGTTAQTPVDFSDLEAFGNNNFSIEMDDLGRVIDHVLNSVPSSEMNKDDLSLIGHSRGGGIAILKSAEDQRVKKLITWASVSEYGHFWSQVVMEKWKKEGVLITKNGRTKQDMPLYYQLYENYFDHLDRLHIPNNAKKLTIPWLIVHGTQDEAVPMSSAEALKSYNSKSELLVIENGNHTFGGKHPWVREQLAIHMQSVVEASVQFLNSKKS